MKSSNTMKVLRGAIAVGSLLLAIGSCGRAADGDELQIDSNTNWLMRCSSDAECSGSLRCYCGQCSQPCAQNDECSLLAGAECASTRGAVCDDQPAPGGLCVLGCSQDVDCGPDFSCVQSQCVVKACSNRFQSWDDVLVAVSNDVRALDADDALFARYISLANHASYAGCGASLPTERQAMDKLLNSLSTETTVTRATPIDVDGTLYRIDLRDYGWNGPAKIGNITYPDVWQALVDSNPVSVRFAGAEADDIFQRTGELVPVMFADSLTATAIRPDVYAGVLDIPGDLRVLRLRLGVDRVQTTDSSFRAGFVSRTEILAIHSDLTIQSGYLWELADVGRDDGALFADPLLNPAGERAIVYTLPNGLQAFAYMDGDSRWLEDSSTFIDPYAPNLRATAPLSLLREHSPRVNVRDEVLSFVRANPDRYNPDALASIEHAYIEPSELDALLRRESETFVESALAAAEVGTRVEPISATYDAHAGDVTLEIAAGEFMVTPEDLIGVLLLLDPALQVLDGGSISRDDFQRLFRDAMCTIGVINDNPPADCP